jgi:hypothetical protein
MNRQIGGLFFMVFLAACEARAANTALTPSPTATPPSAVAAVPSITPTVADTSAPSPTASPSFTPTVTSTSSEAAAQVSSPTAESVLPTGPQGAAGGQCQNILYPLSADRRWVYQVTREDGVASVAASVTAVEGNVASIDLSDPAGGFQSSFTVNCAAGGLTGFSTAEIGFLFYSSDASLEIRTTSGRLAPSEQDLTAANWNYSWTTELVAGGRMAYGDPSAGGIEMVFEEAPVTIDWRTAGAGSEAFESVTVPAGTFAGALKVTAHARFTLVIQAHLGDEDQLLPAVLDLTSLLWYQPHVGLVKQVFASAEIHSGAYAYPLEIPSQMQLLEYSIPQ